MRFDTIIPCRALQPYIRHFVIFENDVPLHYKVYPAPGLVAGFQYKGLLHRLTEQHNATLTTAGITGITDQYMVFGTNGPIGTVLVYFTETGLAHFTTQPVHELFNQCISLDSLFSAAHLRNTEEQLFSAHTDRQRINIIERFFLARLKDIQTDRLILEAIRMIYDSKGTIRIKELHTKLLISQSPLEKRFRRLVGTSPKKFASIVRFNAVMTTMKEHPSMTSLGFEHEFFDQAHFIHSFKRFTGETPEKFKDSL